MRPRREVPDQGPGVQMQSRSRGWQQGVCRPSFYQLQESHKSFFTHENKAHSTALSSHIWDLKSNNTPHSLAWSIVRLAPPYSKESKVCQLCLVEKTIISMANCNLSLNKRNEVVAKCRHRDKWLLKHWYFFYSPPPFSRPNPHPPPPPCFIFFQFNPNNHNIYTLSLKIASRMKHRVGDNMYFM